jgi:hypothetical protein
MYLYFDIKLLTNYFPSSCMNLSYSAAWFPSGGGGGTSPCVSLGGGGGGTSPMETGGGGGTFECANCGGGGGTGWCPHPGGGTPALPSVGGGGGTLGNPPPPIAGGGGGTFRLGGYPPVCICGYPICTGGAFI